MRIKKPALPILHWASLVAQTVKSLSAMRETWVRSLGWEDPLEEGMATHSSILAGRMPWTEEPGGLQSVGPQSRPQLSAAQLTTPSHQSPRRGGAGLTVRLVSWPSLSLEGQRASGSEDRLGTQAAGLQS